MEQLSRKQQRKMCLPDLGQKVIAKNADISRTLVDTYLSDYPTLPNTEPAKRFERELKRQLGIRLAYERAVGELQEKAFKDTVTKLFSIKL